MKFIKHLQRYYKKIVKKKFPFATLMSVVFISLLCILTMGYLLLRPSITDDTAESTALIRAVRQKVLLPDETPTIATVSDPNKLPQQSFFTSALKGDKVLIYTQSKQVVLYRPSTKTVVAVAPLVQ